MGWEESEENDDEEEEEEENSLNDEKEININNNINKFKNPQSYFCNEDYKNL